MSIMSIMTVRDWLVAIASMTPAQRREVSELIASFIDTPAEVLQMMIDAQPKPTDDPISEAIKRGNERAAAAIAAGHAA